MVQSIEQRGLGCVQSLDSRPYCCGMQRIKFCNDPCMRLFSVSEASVGAEAETDLEESGHLSRSLLHGENKGSAVMVYGTT